MYTPNGSFDPTSDQYSYREVEAWCQTKSMDFNDDMGYCLDAPGILLCGGMTDCGCISITDRNYVIPSGVERA